MKIFYISYLITISSKNGMCLCTSCHLIINLLNIFRALLHLIVKISKKLYRCIKIKQTNNRELNEQLINKNEQLFELCENNEIDDYSIYNNDTIYNNDISETIDNQV
jgi:hypothetical protein